MGAPLMPQIEAMIRRHRQAAIVLDTNVLLLFVVGSISAALIQIHRRTAAFDHSDFQLLERLVSRFPSIATTPNVLSEVSNLAMQVRQPWKSAVQDRLKTLVPALRESYYRSTSLVELREFEEFGLTDCGILLLARKGRLVITTDLAQYRMLHEAKCAALIFNQIRDQEWN
jgi:hypothetical protein